MNGIPRPEHPRPRFLRKSWENLNGVWEYAFDFSLSGREKGWNARTSLDGTITVPFCPESARSGVGFTDFLPAVWLLRRFDVPAERLAGDVLLHFGAVDYEAEVFVNGVFAGRHTGGYTPFATGRHGAAARRREHPCRVRAGRRPQRPPAVGQAVGGAGVRGLLLHPHHRRLADRLAGIRAEAASRRLAGFARRAQRQAGFRRLLPRGHGRLRAARSGVFGGKPAGETLLRLGGAAVRGSLAVQPCGCGA